MFFYRIYWLEITSEAKGGICYRITVHWILVFHSFSFSKWHGANGFLTDWPKIVSGAVWASAAPAGSWIFCNFRHRHQCVYMDLFSFFFRFPPFKNDGFLYFSLVPNHPDARFWYFHSPLKINFCQSWIPQFPIRPLAPVHMFLFIFFESLSLLVGNFHCQKMPNFNIFNSSQTQPALKINFHKSWIFHNFRFHQRHQCRSESFLDSFNFCINLSEFWPGFIITTIAPTPLQSKSDLSPVRGQPHVLSICKRGLGLRLGLRHTFCPFPALYLI